MNKVILTGRLTKDIEVEMTSNNKLYVKNSLAVKKDIKNEDGTYGADFINIIAWGNTADYLGKSADKGMLIGIEGRITTRTFDRADGTKGYATEVICTNVELLGKKNDTKVSHQEENKTEQDPFAEFGDSVEVDNDNFLE